MKIRNKYLTAVSVYRFTICIALFILFVSFATLLVHRGIRNKRYEVGLKTSLYILSEALVFVNFLPAIQNVGNEGYYSYLIDTLNTKFDSTNCRYSSKPVCASVDYKTLNGKAVMSDLIFDKGERISIGNALFLLNKPKFPTSPVIIIVDTNGAGSEPNKLGYDVFVFQIIKTKLRAMGNKESLYPLEKYFYYCPEHSTSKDRLLGVNCTYEALTSPKYFSKLK